MTQDGRFSRQLLYPPIGKAGQDSLARARVVLVGLGAVGAAAADMLVRAGVGWLHLCDRDVVEESNLQRQTLFDARHARELWPKAVAARDRLEAIGSPTIITAAVVDVAAESIHELRAAMEPGQGVLCDASDNYETRYLLSDLAVREEAALAYGACLGAVAAAALFVPGRTPCLRCLFPDPPAPGTFGTCDTDGVIAPAAHAAASLMVAMTLRHLVGEEAPVRMVNLDVWSQTCSTIELSAARRDPACVACAQRKFPALEPRPGASTSLCGRDGYQVKPALQGQVDLAAVALRLGRRGKVREGHDVVTALVGPRRLTLFSDGRALIFGVASAAEARQMYAELVGT